MNIRIFVCLTLFGGLLSMANAQEDRKIKFEKTTHEFGSLDKGDPAEYTFQFTNVSGGPVKLSRVKASCGCTTPSYSKDEIAAGDQGEIKVKYNSNRVGPFTKTVTVTYDSVERPIILYIKGNVKNTAAQDNGVYTQPIGNLSF
ncbi:MAG: DUF1573 domain-containing protein, partial [Bacteroidota bacterium]